MKYLSCNQKYKLPVVEFLFGGYWMELRPDDYMLEANGDCLICIVSDPDFSQVILGSSFLRGFYTTHDLETNKFGFGAHKTSDKADPRPGTFPTVYLGGLEPRGDGTKKSGKILLIVAASLLAGAGLAYLIYWIIKGDATASKERNNRNALQILFL